MPFDKEKLPIPEPRRSEPLDEDAIRSQQAGGQPSNNLLVPSDVSLDDSGKTQVLRPLVPRSQEEKVKLASPKTAQSWEAANPKSRAGRMRAKGNALP